MIKKFDKYIIKESKYNLEVGMEVIYRGTQYEDRTGDMAIIVRGERYGEYELEFDDGFIHNGCSGSLLNPTGNYPKKGERIKRPEIDPYDEENWGYENERITTVNEKFGHPDSIKPINDYLTDFVINKFEWWLNRKGPANYGDEFVIDTDDIDPNIQNNKDFPAKIIRLKLNIVISKIINQVTGSALSYKTKRELDPFLQCAKVYRGKIYTGIEIKIITNHRVIEVEELKEEIETTLMHELKHVYQGYKHHMKNISPKEKLMRTIFSNVFTLLINKYWNSDTFANLISSYYPFTSTHEYSAYISEFAPSKTKKIKEVGKYKNILSIMKTDFEILYQKINSEFEKHYKNVDKDNIPKQMIRDFFDACKIYKIDPPDWAMKYYNADFKRFIKLIHDDMIKKSTKFIKKTNKTFYASRMQESRDFSDIDPYGEENWSDENFKIGDEVVCVNNEDGREGRDPILKVGNIYTIIDMKILRRGCLLKFKEIPWWWSDLKFEIKK